MSRTGDAFANQARAWIEAARDARRKRPYTDLVYLPQIELLQYLRAHGFKTYSHRGGQDFVRVHSERVYGIPVEQVVGAAGCLSYEYA